MADKMFIKPGVKALRYLAVSAMLLFACGISSLAGVVIEWITASQGQIKLSFSWFWAQVLLIALIWTALTTLVVVCSGIPGRLEGGRLRLFLMTFFACLLGVLAIAGIDRWVRTQPVTFMTTPILAVLLGTAGLTGMIIGVAQVLSLKQGLHHKTPWPALMTVVWLLSVLAYIALLRWFQGFFEGFAPP